MSRRKATTQQKFLYRCALENWVSTLPARVKTSALPTKPPTVCNRDLLAVYPMGDPHFGMYAWAAEAGDDFDLKIAERLTYAAIDSLVASAPAAREAIILELGDFFHSDSSSNRTEASGNALDVDTRWARVMQIGLRAMTYVVTAALRKHARVTVRIVQGNHDPHSSMALALALDAYFRLEPRVRVDLSPAPFWFYRFGNVLIGATHGHTAKPDKLPTIMSTDAAKHWGETDFRYFYHGHFHHKRVSQEHPGCVVEGFRTLAAKDAWHAGQGYRSGRDMTAIIHHRKLGERVRYTWPIQMMGSQRSSGALPISTSRKARHVTKQGARSR